MCCNGHKAIRGAVGLATAAANTATGNYDPHREQQKRAVCERCEHVIRTRVTSRWTVLRCGLCSCVLVAKWRSGEPCPDGRWV